MVVYEYVERAVADLFEPFSLETLPELYHEAYQAETTDGGRLGRLRMYGEIHSLSETQLAAYNQIANSAERSHYLELQKSTFIINREKAKQQAWAVENALRQGLDVSTAAVGAANIPLQAPQPMNGPTAGGYEGPNVTIHVPRESIKDETKEMIPPEMLSELLLLKRRDVGPLPEDCVNYDPTKHKRGVVFWFDQLAVAIQQYGGDKLSRKARLWRYLKHNQGCQTQCVHIHKEHTDKEDTTYIDIVALYRTQLKDEAYLASQKSAYASRKQHPGEDPVSYANLVAYLENEAMPKLYDRQGDEPQRDGRGDEPQRDRRCDEPQRDERRDEPQRGGQRDVPQRDGRQDEPQLDERRSERQLDAQRDDQQRGYKVHSQPVESFVNRVVWERDKHWMKQRLIWKMSTGQIKTREDVQSCLNQAVNELRLSKANNIDPSCAYPNTMSNLNTDRYALSAPDVPGLYDTQPDQDVSALEKRPPRLTANQNRAGMKDPAMEHSAIQQMGKTSAYTCQGYLGGPAVGKTPSEPVTILVDSGNTTAATAAISLTCANRLGLQWTKTTPRKNIHRVHQRCQNDCKGGDQQPPLKARRGSKATSSEECLGGGPPRRRC